MGGLKEYIYVRDCSTFPHGFSKKSLYTSDVLEKIRR